MSPIRPAPHGASDGPNWSWSASLVSSAGAVGVPGLSPTTSMGPAAIERLFERYLASGVHSPEETQRVIRTLEKIPDMLDAHTLTLDRIMSHCVKLVAANHETVKRLACQLLIRVAQEQPDVALLAANVLHLDRQDPNPNVRAVAVATLCSIPILAEAHAVAAIQAAWQDSNPRVRQAGVTGCGKVWFHSPTVVESHGLIDALYQRIKDPDPSVLTFTMQTLNYVLAQEGGIVINGHMAQYLLQRLPDFPDVELLFVLEYLSQFVSASPAISGDIKLQMVNQLDPYFDSANGPVFLAAGVLFYRTALDLLSRSKGVVSESRLLSDFLKRIRPLMSKFLKPSSQPAIQDFQVQLLDFVLSWDRKLAVQVSNLWLDFRIKDSKDLTPLKARKVRAMAHVVSTASEIEMSTYILSLFKSQNQLAEVLIVALLDMCEYSSNHEALSKTVMHEFQTLVQEDPRIGLTILRQLRAVDRVLKVGLNPEFLRLLLADIAKRPNDLNDFQVLANVLWALGTYGQQIAEAPYILEFIIEEKFDLIEKWELQQSLLFNGFQCFLMHPGVMQPVFGRIGEMCSDSTGAAGRIDLYFKLLSQPAVLARQKQFLSFETK